ncbi:MAG: TAXI family TRAP transporter solute-binding subunit [Alphaproteobacteria bacterium]|nr:TAXI family TRAP transporter solute-binding subunit [Alphaproteobacteria bacterium]
MRVGRLVAWIAVVALCAGAAGHAVAAAKLRLSIATGGTGGVFYPYGGGLARVLSKHVGGFQVTAEVTGGSVDNVKLVGIGDADIGFSTIDSAVDGVNGAGAYQDTGPQKIRAIAVLYDSFVHIVTRSDSKIAKVVQMKGKRVSVGSAGSSTEAIADRLLEAAGLNPMKDVTRDNLGVSESVAALKDGKIDAMFWIGGLPTSAITDLVTTGNTKVTFVPAGDLVAKLNAKHPDLYRSFTMSKAIYAGTPADVPGVGVANILFVGADMKAETVDKILKGVFDNLAEVQKIHPEAKTLTLEGAAAKTAIPFHPAATAFYKARGAIK